MRRRGRVLLLLAALLPVGAWAGEVISNASISLTPNEIRDVFLGEKLLVHGMRLVPIDNSAAQDEFLAKMLQTDAPKYYARWTRKSFHEGISAPALKGSDAEVIAFVKATPGAIGYIKGHSKAVNILQTF